MHKQQQAAIEVDKKLLDMELKICKTFNDTMEQHVEVVKAIKEEMVAIWQLQEKQGIFWWHWSLVFKSWRNQWRMILVVRINLRWTPWRSIWIHPLVVQYYSRLKPLYCFHRTPWSGVRDLQLQGPVWILGDQAGTKHNENRSVNQQDQRDWDRSMHIQWRSGRSQRSKRRKHFVQWEQGVAQFSGLSYSRTQFCNWPVSIFDIGNIICWIYIGTVGTLFVLPCSLSIVISFGARAWGIVWARLAFCLVILLLCHWPR